MGISLLHGIRWILATATMSPLLLASQAATAQGGLGPEFQVNPPDAYYHASPDIGMAESGDYIVVWTSFTLPFANNSIRARRFDAAGSPFGSDFQVNTVTTGYQFRPSVAVNASGEAIVVWENDFGIAGQRFAASGSTIGGEFVISADPDVENSAGVAINDSGSSIVVWASNGSDGSDTDGKSVQARRYDSNGQAIGTRFQVNTSTTGNQYSAGVSMASTGAAVVVWAETLAAPGIVAKGQRFDASGNPAGSEFNLGQTSFPARSAVAHTPSDSFVIAWDSIAEEGLRLQRYDASGSAIGSPFIAADDVSWESYLLPDLAVDAGGDLVVSWLADNEPDWAGFAQRFNGAGSPIGDQFQVYTYGCCTGQNPPGPPRVAVDASGGLVVVWGDVFAGGDILGRSASALPLPSLGALGLLGLAAFALVAGVRSLQRAPRR